MIKPAEFIHPEDAAALRQLESIPGFPALVKKIMALGFLPLFRKMIYLKSSIKQRKIPYSNAFKETI